MKEIIFSLLITGFFIGINSCICTKKYCVGFDNLNEIQLNGFSTVESDSVAVEIFNSGSNFTDRIDSSFTSAIVSVALDTNMFIKVQENIHTNHDYKITLISTGQFYKLTDFITRKVECNCPSDLYNVLDSYSINGQKQSNLPLAISK